MIDVVGDPDRITFAELADRLPRDARGRQVSAACLIRYATKGYRGARLSAARVGHRWYTTAAAANEFFAALAGPIPAPKPVGKLSQAHLAADRRLQRLGM